MPAIALVGMTVEWVHSGNDAAAALRARIAAVKGDEPLAPVTVVVPSNHVGAASRRLLASGSLGPSPRQRRAHDRCRLLSSGWVAR